MESDIERIKMIVSEMSRRCRTKDGEVKVAGVDGGTVKIAPAGFCWR